MTSSKEITGKRIAFLMKQSGVDISLVDRILSSAMEFEGQYDLLCMWRDAISDQERGEILADLIDVLKDTE